MLRIQQAAARLAGKPRPDYLTDIGNRLWIGAQPPCEAGNPIRRNGKDDQP